MAEETPHQTNHFEIKLKIICRDLTGHKSTLCAVILLVDEHSIH